MPKRRISKRLAFRHNIRYGPTNPPEHVSFITDLSDTGVYIKTNKVFRPGTKLYLVIETGHKSYKAEGVVVWAKKAPTHLIQHTKSGMGIKFTSVDQALVDEYRDRA
ncbi:MAG: PilZ domain-containing protein [Thermodesulfobacteriota bacterium]|nr:MAG: PilZ domain-containing protein [Thermodesulfobacteriota bacterium]